MTHAIVPFKRSTPPPDIDSHILAMWILFLATPARPNPEPDGFYTLGEIGDAPEKTWTKATPYSLAQPKI